MQVAQWRSTTFIYSLLFASFFFYLAGPVLHAAWWPFQDLHLPDLLTAMVGAHVGLSYYFYLDRKSYPVIHDHKWRYFGIVPLVFIVNFALFTVMTLEQKLFFQMAVVGWNFWHFQRQHYGVYCFIKQYEGVRATLFERNFILWAALPALIMQIYAMPIAAGTPAQKEFIAPFQKPITVASMIVCAGLVFLAVRFIVRDWKCSKNQIFRRRWLPALFLGFLSLSYLPYYFMPAPKAMFMSSSGHGLQYIVFMIVVAMQRNQEMRTGPGPSNLGVFLEVVWKMAVGIAILVGTGYGLYYVSIHAGGWKLFGENEKYNQALASIGISITVSHFIQDAAMWRLSHPVSRQYVQRYFGFLFPRPAVAAVEPASPNLAQGFAIDLRSESKATF